jgi:hypothetical protein
MIKDVAHAVLLHFKAFVFVILEFISEGVLNGWNGVGQQQQRSSL